MYTFFNNMDDSDIKVPIKDKNTLSSLLKKIKAVPLDPGLRPLINLVPTIIEQEKKNK